MFNVVTSFGPGGYEKYGQRFIETFLQYWPKNVKLTAYYHDHELPEDAKRFSFQVDFVNLNAVDPEFVAFKERAKHADGTSDGQYNYRKDALKFSAKVFATSHLAGQLREGQLIWLDADTFSHAPVSNEFIETLFPDDGDMICLRRTSIYYSETSFVLFNLDKPPALQFLCDMRDLYVDGEIFFWQEWHDGFIFERLMYVHILHGMKVFSLTPPDFAGLEAFEKSVLNTVMHHLKGDLKDKPKGGAILVSRYDQLKELVKFYANGKKTFNLLETGTWSGKRAIEMANAAFEAGVMKVCYHGYDLFEGANDALDKEEFNSKPHNSRAEVVNRLEEYSQQVKRNGRTFNYLIVQGDTKKRFKSADNIDFAYLDGGHSEETAAHDYLTCSRSNVPVIVMDDYITPDPRGGDQPVQHKGTNTIFDIASMGAASAKIYDSNDPVMGGGITHLAAIVNDENAKPLPFIPCPQGPSGWKPLIVQPKDCVEDTALIENVEKNIALIPDWIAACKPHSRMMIIASGGPELETQVEEIKQRVQTGALVLAVKHALPYLKKAGIVPWGLIVLDPRDIGEDSTHGVKRQDLFDLVDPETICFVASMTNPQVTEFLQAKGNKIVGWHAYTQGLAQYKKWPVDTQLIVGGTCSAWRGISLGNCLGFNEFHIYGADLSVAPEGLDMKATDDMGRPKYLTVSADGGATTFVSTGELIAAGQDIQTFVQMANQGNFEFYVHGTKFGAAVYNRVAKEGMKRLKLFGEAYS